MDSNGRLTRPGSHHRLRGRRFPDFVRLLKEHGVDILVDVRRFPASKVPEFGRRHLEAELPLNGMRYTWMGEALGGFRRGGYEGYARTEEYARGIEELLGLAGEGRVAIMCVKRSPRACHRRYISETLERSGARIVHITGSASGGSAGDATRAAP